MKNKQECLLAACTGKAVPLSQVPDEVFAQGILGEGIAIEPAEGRFFAPVSGKMESIVFVGFAENVLVALGIG